MLNMIARQALAWRGLPFTVRIQSFQKWNKATQRNFDLKTLNAALKPFLFLVHPDLFGNFPEKRKINEESLTSLNSFLQGCVGKVRKPSEEVSLRFFIRDPQRHQDLDSINEISVKLKGTSPLIVVQNILRSAGLPGLESMEKIPLKTTKKLDKYIIDHYPIEDLYYEEERPTKETLVRFFEQKCAIARTRLKNTLQLRNQNLELIENICKDFGVKSLVVKSDWTVRLLHGYLKNLYESLNRHKDEVWNAAGWCVVLSLWDGVDVDGTINLNIENEPLSWIELLSSAERFAAVMENTENLIVAISEMLGGLTIIKAVHGKKNYHLEDFHNHLKDLYSKFAPVEKKVDFDLSNFEAVISMNTVEQAVVLPNGSFLIPLSMGGLEIISFLKRSIDVAKQVKQINERQQMKETKLTEHCITYLKLKSLTKGPEINHVQMISCCENMVDLIDISDLTKDLEKTNCMRKIPCVPGSENALLPELLA